MKKLLTAFLLSISLAGMPVVAEGREAPLSDEAQIIESNLNPNPLFQRGRGSWRRRSRWRRMNRRRHRREMRRDRREMRRDRRENRRERRRDRY